LSELKGLNVLDADYLMVCMLRPIRLDIWVSGLISSTFLYLKFGRGRLWELST
jgi:hypothetical protein